MDVDNISKRLGGTSTYQVMVILATLIGVFGSSFTTQLAVFFSAVPDHRCSIPTLDDGFFPNLTEENITNLFIPSGDSCHRYAYNFTVCMEEDSLACISNESNVGIIKCTDGYNYSTQYYQDTTISEWDLVCGRETLDSVANSFYFFGFFCASFVGGWLMDLIGRRLTILISTIGLIVSGVCCAFANNFVLYVALRVPMAGFAIATFLSSYTYITEISDTRKRTLFATICSLISSIGHSLLPGLAYLFRDWRYLCLITTLLSSPFIVIFFFIPKSPRWLASKGRDEEALKILERYSKSKGTLLEVEEEDKPVLGTVNPETVDPAKIVKKQYSFFDIMKLPYMRIITLITMYDWFVVSMVYYGLTLNVGKLAGNPYVNATMNGFIEFVACLVYFPILVKLGRRATTSMSYLMGATCCLTSMFLTQFANGNQGMIQGGRWIAISGKLFASISFTAIYQFTADLHPTVTRGKGMGLGSMAARVGSMIMPFTLQLQYAVPWITQAIFGSLGLVAGLVTLILPETKSTGLLTTMEEAEKFYAENINSRCKKRSSQTVESADFKLELIH